jgi:AcrR family transcriptional regulator
MALHMTAATTRGPYAKSAAVRRKILEACVEAFSETGFYGATMKDIAHRAGISHTGLLHHFARKEDLLLAVLEVRAEQSTDHLAAADALDASRHPLEALRGVLAVAAENQRTPGLLELHTVLSGEASSPEHPAHEYYTQRFRNLRAYYALAFSALAERGQLRSSVAPQALATMLLSLLNGLQGQWLYDRASVDVRAGIRDFLAPIVPDLGE